MKSWLIQFSLQIFGTVVCIVLAAFILALDPKADNAVHVRNQYGGAWRNHGNRWDLVHLFCKDDGTLTSQAKPTFLFLLAVGIAIIWMGTFLK